ncbi:hypothetical protein ACHAWC_000546 [Mediolabrus comicus]
MSKNNTSSSSPSSRRRPPRRSLWKRRSSNQAASNVIICTIVYNIYIIINNTSTTHAFSSSSNPQPPPPPPFTNPQTPEEVVQNQLHYYQTSNLSAVYELNSPENKEATGSISNLQSSLTKPPYNTLLNFERADVLLEVLPDAFMEDEESNDTSLCLVCIRPNRKLEKCNSVWFWWELSRHKMIDEENNGDDTENDNDNDATTTGEEEDSNDNEMMQWMVDCVIPDFEDLDFETDSLSIEEFGGEEGGDDDDLTIYWDVGGL